MSQSKAIRCEKCHVEMSVRHYVLVHRKPPVGACPPVPCEVCREPARPHGLTAFGDAVCSTRCFSRHPGYSTPKEMVRNIRDQLRAIRRAEKLPLVYERRLAS